MQIGDRVKTPDGVGTICAGGFWDSVDSPESSGMYWRVELDVPVGWRVFCRESKLELIDEEKEVGDEV
jgi:hypothetical protein